MQKIELYVKGLHGESYMGSFASYREVNAIVANVLRRSAQKQQIGKGKFLLGQAVTSEFVIRHWLSITDKDTGAKRLIRRTDTRRFTVANSALVAA